MRDEISIPCPVCSKGSNHCSINIKKKVIHCFRCGYSARLTKELALEVGLEWEEHYRPLEEKEEKKVEIRLPPRSSWTTESMRYIKDRGLSIEQIRKHGLYYCAIGYYKHRIIIPIRTCGELVGFQARTIRKDEKRYIFPKGFRKSAALYGFDMCPRNDGIVVVEGCFDLFAVESAGYNCVATFGKTISKAQVELVASLSPTHITLLYDGDADTTEAYSALQRICPTSIGLLGHGDPAECDDLVTVIEDARNSTLDVDLFFIEQVCSSYK